MSYCSVPVSSAVGSCLKSNALKPPKQKDGRITPTSKAHRKAKLSGREGDGEEPKAVNMGGVHSKEEEKAVCMTVRVASLPNMVSRENTDFHEDTDHISLCW